MRKLVFFLVGVSGYIFACAAIAASGTATVSSVSKGAVPAKSTAPAPVKPQQSIQFPTAKPQVSVGGMSGSTPQTLPSQMQSPRSQLFQSVAPAAAAPTFIPNANGTVTVRLPSGSETFMTPQQAAAEYGYQMPSSPNVGISSGAQNANGALAITRPSITNSPQTSSSRQPTSLNLASLPIPALVVSASPMPTSSAGTQAGAVLGSLTLAIQGRATPITLVSQSSGTQYQGSPNGPIQYQCVALIRNYASQLGVPSAATAALGNGSDTAQKLAELSGSPFTYFSGLSATSPPSLGSVISLAGFPNDPDGHVGIAQSVAPTGTNQVKVTLFDQNWPYAAGQQWVTATFTKTQQGVWVGMVHDTNAPDGVLDVSGWANPTF
jgi:CHAP domain-containing protein